MCWVRLCSFTFLLSLVCGPCKQLAGPQLSWCRAIVCEMCAKFIYSAVIQTVFEGYGGSCVEGFHFFMETTIFREKSSILFLPIREDYTAGSQWLCWSPCKSVLNANSTFEHFALSGRPIKVRAGCPVEAGLLTLWGILRKYNQSTSNMLEIKWLCLFS